MNKKKLFSVISAGLAFGLGEAARAQVDAGDEALIYTAARLPQAAHETPAAITVIDQEMIRLSGARKLADLMQLVPGIASTATCRASPTTA